MNDIKPLSMWSTDTGEIYGVIFDPVIDNGESTVTVFEPKFGNITGIKTEILTTKISEFYDMDVFTTFYGAYVLLKIKKQE